MSDQTVSDVAIGPPQPSGADFYLPQRGSKSLDAAKIRIGTNGGRLQNDPVPGHGSPPTGGSDDQ
jgi:hypothetical protein